MSRQNKQARKAIISKQFTALHLRGERGPSRTNKTSKKVNTWVAAKRSGRTLPSHHRHNDD